jgi:formylmethanofuran dehydrogenase subunit C
MIPLPRQARIRAAGWIVVLGSCSVERIPVAEMRTAYIQVDGMVQQLGIT